MNLLVGLGANLPTSSGRSALQSCRWALRRLPDMLGAEVIALSDWYLTAPVPVSDDPDYFNGVAALRCNLPPEQALARLHALEAEAGRVRAGVNAPRVLDLDLLDADGAVCTGPGLTLPHPRLAERAFVLYPLADIAPQWRHPVLQRSAAELRDSLPPQRIERLPPAPEDLLLRATLLK